MLPTDFLNRLQKLFTATDIISDTEQLALYGTDTSRHRGMPDIVVFVHKHQQVQDLIKLCYEFEIPLTARGLGSGTPGGCVPLKAGVVISLEKMNKIIDIDPANRCMRVETGVSNQTVQDKTAEYGFFWAPDPGSAAICTVGGNLAFNAAGPRAIKYGTTRENTLGLTAVIGTGETIHTGTYTSKGAVGYDLTRLLIGSEGTLGIITEATLKLTPLPQSKSTLRLFYRDIASAALASTKIMAQPSIPCALEYMDKISLQLIQKYGVTDIPEDAGAMLLIDIDGSPTEIKHSSKAIQHAANINGLLNIQVAKNEAESKLLWSARKSLSPALKTLGLNKINEDVVVPVSRIPDLLAELDKLSQYYKILIITFGHAGNGNIHVNLMVDPNDSEQTKRAELCLSDIFDKVIALQGTLSGEHGIGIEKREFMPRAVDAVSLRLMREIKKQFDPKNILNPGKIFPSASSV